MNANLVKAVRPNVKKDFDKEAALPDSIYKSANHVDPLCI